MGLLFECVSNTYVLFNYWLYFLFGITCEWFSQGAIATSLTQPLDVLKTRSMNAKPGEFKNLFAIIIYTAKLGPMGFFKGYIPAFVRLAPQTILTFMFLEQLRMNFGFIPMQQAINWSDPQHHQHYDCYFCFYFLFHIMIFVPTNGSFLFIL